MKDTKNSIIVSLVGPPPAPQPPPRVSVEMSLEDAQALEALAMGIGGASKAELHAGAIGIGAVSRATFTLYKQHMGGLPDTAIIDRLRRVGHAAGSVVIRYNRNRQA